MNKLRILLLQGGVSSEHDVSLHSGIMTAKALDAKKYNVSIVTIGKDGRWVFGDSRKRLSAGAALRKIELAKFDVAFIALHGLFGEDGHIQSLFDAIGLPYTGSGPEASALAMNKAVSNILFKNAGLDVPPFIYMTRQSDFDLFDRFRYPAVVKPCHGGSSLNVIIANDRDSARTSAKKIFKEGDSVIVQKYISGREFTCGVLDNENGDPESLPPTEIVPMKGCFFDFRAKYKPGASREITPPYIASSLIRKLRHRALIAHQVLGCRGMSRSDFIFNRGKFYLLEINTIPGLTTASLLPQEAQAAGFSFSKMLDRIVYSALRKSHNVSSLKKLANKEFTSKAPAKVVEEMKAKKTEAEAKVAALKERIGKFA